jgi:uncharacterized protein YoxC
MDFTINFEQPKTYHISNDELTSRILELESQENNTNKNITDHINKYNEEYNYLINKVKELSETITKMNKNIKKLEDEIKYKSEKEHQIMQLFRILKTPS